MEPLPHSISAFEDPSLEFVSAESIFPQDVDRLSSLEMESQELWCPYRHALGKGECSNLKAQESYYILRENMGLVSHSLPMLELQEATSKSKAKEAYQPYIQSASHLVLSKENAVMDKDSWTQIFKAAQSNITKCLKEGNPLDETRDAADCTRDNEEGGPFSNLLTFRVKGSDPNDERSFRYFYTPFLTSSPSASSPKDLIALPPHQDFRSDSSFQEHFPRSSTLGFPKDDDFLVAFEWKVTLSQASSARAKFIREIDLGSFLDLIMDEWKNGNDMNSVESAQMEWQMQTVFFLTGNWTMQSFDWEPLRQFLIGFSSFGLDFSILLCK